LGIYINSSKLVNEQESEFSYIGVNSNMKHFLVEGSFVILGTLISILFIFNPSPFLMFAFAFIAQPLFLFAIMSSIWMIYKDP